MKFCREPFENIEITNSGDVFFCCAHDVQYNYIGNINKQSFDEIWNSPKAIEIRTKILNNDYSCCSKELCYRLSNPDLYFDEKKEHFTSKVNQYPLEIKLMHDFVRLSREHNARPSFWEIRNYNNFVNEQYSDLAVHLEEHPEHKNLVKILEDPVFDNLESHELFPVLANLRKKKQEV